MRAAESMVHVGPLLNENGFIFGKILIQRDEKDKEKTAHVIYSKIPKKIVGRKIFLVDNMLATAGSSIKAIKHL